MIKLAKQALGKASKEMIKEAGKEAGKKVVKIAVVGGVVVAGNHLRHNIKETGVKLVKDTDKAIKDGSQEIADVIQKKKKPDMVAAGKKVAGGVVKTAGKLVLIGAGTVVAAKTAEYVRNQGNDLAEEIAADYRKVRYFVEEEMTVEINEDEIEYL